MGVVQDTSLQLSVKLKFLSHIGEYITRGLMTSACYIDLQERLHNTKRNYLINLTK